MKNKREIIIYPFSIMAMFLLMLTYSCKDDENKDPLNKVRDIDGNLYHTVTIGTQVWMVENLNVTHYRNGKPIQNITIDSLWMSDTIGAYCNHSNKDSLGLIYGKLYNWYAVNNPLSLAPAGWHVPSDAEWTELINYLGGDSVAGAKLKEAGTKHWKNPIYYKTTNESGFTALPGGNRDCNGYFGYDFGFRGFWWSSTGGDTYGSFYRWMVAPDCMVYRWSYCEKTGFSVRCIKDN
jgi:uncharacterized protein (TIGR02145 family)